jgi:hypothetical protein
LVSLMAIGRRAPLFSAISSSHLCFSKIDEEIPL